jgi:tetratricopeptide (TPR) repeat protein
LISKNRDSQNLYFELGKLYYSHGDFEQAVQALSKTGEQEAKKLLAVSFYRLGNFTAALEIFEKENKLDEDYLYYYALTCEKLNLFDQALAIYRKLGSGRLKSKAGLRIELIEKQAKPLHIRNIDPQVYKITSVPQSVEDYPQAGALILYCDERIEIASENTQVSSLHYIVKILNERGKEDFAEVGIDYDSTYEKIELEYARTIRPDGLVAEVGSRHIRDVSKYLNFPLYSNARVYIISFPEVSEGSCIEYKLKIHRSQLMNKKDFILSYPLQTSEPILLANFNISLPKERPLHLKIINDRYNDFGAELKPEVQEDGHQVVYRWQFKNIPQIIPESRMPPFVTINPTILVSTFSSWKDIHEWWWGLAKDKLEIDAAIREKVDELCKNRGLAEEKIKAIYNFCAQKIRYVAVEYGRAGYEPHNATLIFKNKYGDCKDQAILLVTMLKEAGFSSWPVLIPTKDYYNLNEDFPSAMFNHCIAALLLNGKIIFLDPTAETCPFGDLPAQDQGRRVLIIQKDSYKISETDLYPAGHNLNRQQLKIKINSDESINAEKTIFTYGIYNQAQRYWLLYTQPALVQEVLREKIQEVSIGSSLKQYEIENLPELNKPVVLRYSFWGLEYFTDAGNLRLLPQMARLDASLVAKERRRYPMDFGILDSKETTIEIEIPTSFVIKYMPESISQDSPWLKYAAEYQRIGKNKLSFRERIELKKNIIPQEEYAFFKAFYEKLAKKIKQRIVAERAE